MIFAKAIPDEFGVKGVSGDHGKNDHETEGDGGSSGLDRHEISHLNQSYQNGNDKDIDHGPAADEFGEVVESIGPLRVNGDLASSGGAERAECEEFKTGNENAGDENDDGYGVGFELPEGGDSSQDGAFLFDSQLGDKHDREKVGRDVSEDACESVGEAAGEAVLLASMQDCATAWAMFARNV